MTTKCWKVFSFILFMILLSGIPQVWAEGDIQVFFAGDQEGHIEPCHY